MGTGQHDRVPWRDRTAAGGVAEPITSMDALPLAAELVAREHAPCHVPHLDDPVTFSDRPATVRPPAGTPDREVNSPHCSVLVKPDMTDHIAGTPTGHVRPKRGSRADREAVRPSDEFSIRDVSPHTGTSDR